MGDRIKGITIEIGGDTTGLNKALSGVNSEIRNTQSQLKDVERLLKLDPSNTELLRQRQKLLSEAVGETGKKLETLKEAEKQAQKQFEEGKISEQQYEALKREIIAVQQQLDTLKEKADGANVALQKIGQAGEKVKDFGGKLTDAGQELSKVSAGLVAVGTAGVAAWKTMDDAYDTIAKGTGATGEALEGLQQSFDNVFASIPTDAAIAGGAIADINTRFGFVGEALEDCTRKFIQFGEVNNTDVSDAIAKVSRYMGDAGIDASKYGEVLDQLTAASQASGISIDKLTEDLTKYGAPMRALGFDTKESIAIFAGWEKAGVNTEIAFSGMKKAIGTWGKQGKDARKEFKKTLDEIEKCPDIASATAKAIEVFGQKAGPDLADAIKGGRFAYEDFLKVVEGSEGQLEQTFNDTLDPIDNVKVSMQNLTVQASRLGGAILSTLAPMMSALAEKLSALAEWFGSLNEAQQKAVAVIGLVVAAIGPLLIIIGQVATGIGGLMTAISGMGTLLTALSAAGGPLFLAAMAATALASAFVLMEDNASSYCEAAWEVTEAEQGNMDAVDALRGSYEQLEERREESISGIESQTDHERSLWEELKGIADENGKVKEGYADRAAFITQTLSQALGTEIKMTGDVIDGYRDLQGEIGNLIEKKRQEALMDVYQQEYSQALKDRRGAQEKLSEAVSNSKAATDNYNASLEKEKALQEEYNRLMGQYAQDGTNDTIRQQLYDIQDQMTMTGEATEGFRQKMGLMNGNLGEARAAWEGINTTIANYEGASVAIISGDQQRIAESLLLLERGFKTAETSTKESLQAQHEAIKTELANAKAAMAEGASGMDQEYIAGLEQLEMKARAELGKLAIAAGDTAGEATGAVKGKRGDMEAAGGDLVAGLPEGIRGGEGGVRAAAGSMADAGVDAARSALDSHSSSRGTHGIGLDFAAGMSGGIQEGAGQVMDAVTQLSMSAVQGLASELQKAGAGISSFQASVGSGWSAWAAGLSASSQASLSAISATWSTGWKEMEGAHRSSMDSIKATTEAALAAIKGAVTADVGAMMADTASAMQGMVSGAQAELGRLRGVVEAGFQPAISYITSLKSKAGAWGSDMMAGYVSGVRSKLGELERACAQTANVISSYLHHSTPDEGPMMHDDTWMPDMMQQFAKGIRDNIHLVGSAAEATAERIGDSLAAGLADSVRQQAGNAGKSAEEMAKAILEAAQKRLKDHKVYNKLTLKDEVDYWDAVRKQVDEGTQARMDADERYFKAKQDLDGKMEAAEKKYTDNVAKAYADLNDKIQGLNKTYQDAVSSRADQIRSSFGLFDEFKAGTDLTADKLLGNLQSQVDGLRQWRANLKGLGRRGIGDDLLAELEGLGPKAAAEIQLMTEMSDAQLDEYVGLFKAKNRIARQQAVSELEPMREEIASQIEQMGRETEIELRKYQQEYTAAMAELGAAVNQPLEGMKVAAAQNATALVMALADTVKDVSGSPENVSKFAQIATNVLGAVGTLQSDMQGIGQNAIAGIIAGLQEKAPALYAAAREIAQGIGEAMAHATGFDAQVASLSTVRPSGGAKELSGIERALNTWLPRLKSGDREAAPSYLVLDTGEVVGRLAPGMDGALGGIQAKAIRGG